MPITDGPVEAVLRDGNTLYLGGKFFGIGPSVPYGASIGIATGKHNPNFVNPNGSVNVVVSDGAGGWYIGGDFTRVGGVTRNHLARINADGSLHSWNPNSDGTVYSLCISGNTLYVGGAFSELDGQPRNNSGAFNTTTG
ncbi:MAG: delta-60 repeat domain-containing protein, partial [Chitinophagaceae bacterium]|nr:delta-60 repeat domain-containing protein [Chitinophagaceae bacterium]